VRTAPTVGFWLGIYKMLTDEIVFSAVKQDRSLEPLPECLVFDLGEMDYEASLATQSKMTKLLKNEQLPDCILFVQYPHTLTLGRAGKIEHLLASKRELERRGVSFHLTDRGGDITYHGPGQLIVYPILDLKRHRRDIHWYLRNLETCIIRTLATFDIVADRIAGATGVWVQDRKIAAIGVRTSQWVTSHGLALNVNTDLSFFDLIVPCGIANKKMTSMAQVLKVKDLELHAVRSQFCHHFGIIFNRALRDGRPKDLLTN
jgi:lipoyl(octanoyl) transferase